MGLLEDGYELKTDILDKHNLLYISNKFNEIFDENSRKIDNKEYIKKYIPENQSFEFSANKERKLIENLEFYERDNSRLLICVHNVEEYYPEVKEFFFNAIYDRVLNSLPLEGRFKFDRINLIKKTDNDNHSMDWHRDFQFVDSNLYYNINVGLYLDESIKGRDAVSFLKGSHKFNKPEFIKENIETLEANAGDVILHFGSTFHESPCYIESSFSRRTVYYRFLYEPFEC